MATEHKRDGNREPRSSTNWFSTIPWARVFTAFLPIVFAALLRFIDGDELRCCFSGACGDGFVCSKWTLWLSVAASAIAVILVVLLFRLLTSDEQAKQLERERLDARERRLAEQEQAFAAQEATARQEREEARVKVEQGFRSIAMVPNLAIVIEDYDKLFRGMEAVAQPYQILNRFYTAKATPDPSVKLAEAATSIRAALAFVTRLTRLFGEATVGKQKEDPTLHANLMLPFEAQDLQYLPEEYLSQALLPGVQSEGAQRNRRADGLIRFAEEGLQPNTLDALLVLQADLIAIDSPTTANPAAQREQAMPSYGTVCLPVRRHPRTQLLPGAPFAYIHGGISVQADARSVAKESKGKLPDYIVAELKHYFREGPGRDLGSFYSVRLHPQGHPIAVLSVDSNAQALIGTTDDQSKAFLALLVPMLALLTPMADYYAKLWRQVLSLDLETGRDATPPTPPTLPQ